MGLLRPDRFPHPRLDAVHTARRVRRRPGVPHAPDRRRPAEPGHRHPHGKPPPSQGVGRSADDTEPPCRERPRSVGARAAVSRCSPVVADEHLRPPPRHPPPTADAGGSSARCVRGRRPPRPSAKLRPTFSPASRRPCSRKRSAELAHEHHHQHQHQHEAVASTDASEPPTSGEVSLRDLLTIAADVGLRYVLARQEMGTEGSPPARPLPPPGRRCRARRLPRRSQAGPCRTLSPGDGRPNQVTGTRTVSHRRARAPAVQLTSPSHLLRVPARRARLERRQPQLTHGPRQAAAPASAARARTPMPSAEAFGPAPPCPFPRSRRPFPPNAQRRA